MITSADKNIETLNRMASTKQFRLKGAASTKKELLLLKGMVLTTGNYFHEKQRLSLKRVAFTKGNGFH